MADVESRTREQHSQHSLTETSSAYNGFGDPYTSSPQPQTPTGSRPSSQYSGSDYSQPQTPNESRSSYNHHLDMDTDTTAPEFEDISLKSRPASGFPDANPSQLLHLSSSELPAVPQIPSSHSRTSSLANRNQIVERSPSTATGPVSPITPREAHMSVMTLQSIALSESDYYDMDSPTTQTSGFTPTNLKEARSKHSRKPSSLQILENVWESTWSGAQSHDDTRPSPPTRQSTLFDMTKDQPLTPTTPTSQQGQKEQEFESVEINESKETNEDQHLAVQSQQPPRGSSLPAMDSSSVWRTRRISSLYAPTYISELPEEDELVVDWSQLDRTEEQEKEDKDLPVGAEDESTQFLLARLEQENAKLTTDPKSSTGSVVKTHVRTRTRTQTRPPSMAHLKKLVSRQDPPSIRYSLISDVQSPIPEEPPAMTELEFWAALVQDYPSCASRLPTLTTTKIRAGIPPPLRGVVWTAMAGARDHDLEESFETLKNEESPYEGLINKDVGRSFPGVELFRDAEGEGQKMLGRVLKCFSLHDKDIGYCQGLGFLVGPLLMNMGEKEAFCVLVRLMEHYALRPSFLPSLSGLHMRIFQFSALLNQYHPTLSQHLGELGIEPAYLSQWFLSCFAVTCPLPLLFRIYDVIFAEGANETVMRVAMALFRRNEEKMMASTEFEEVMQLLLGRSLWDVYACNPDELVDDFTSLDKLITHARLAELEAEFENKSDEAVGQSAGFLPDVQAAASRFLGRLWTPNPGATPSKAIGSTLTPQSAEKDGSAMSYLTRPGGFLRRSPSKPDMGVTTDSTSSAASASSGSASITSTAPTESEVHDTMSHKSKSESIITVSGHGQQMSITSGAKNQELQTEIEDLLMALSELQREHALMTNLLQKEREERSDDHRVVRELLAKLTNSETEKKAGQRRSMPPPSRPNSQEIQQTSFADKRKTLPPRPRLHIRTDSRPVEKKVVVDSQHKELIEGLVNDVQARLDSNGRFSASFETRAQLRATLARAREQLTTSETQIKDLGDRADSAEASLTTFQAENESLRSEVDELRARVNDDFKARQKLELELGNLQIQMRMEAKALDKKQRNASLARADSSGDIPSARKGTDSPGRSRQGSLSSNPGNPAGLRDLKLGRPDSNSSVASIRSLKNQRQTEDEWPAFFPAPVEIPTSPPRSPTIEVTPTAPPQPTIPTTSSLTVPAPSGPNFGRRTSSLATQEVFATTQHEPVPADALLLELVNAKTAEASARQEIDEMKKAMQTQKKRTDESLLELQAEIANAKLEAERARHEAEEAREEARQARAEVFDASPLPTPITPGVGNSPVGRTATFPVMLGEQQHQGKRASPGISGNSSSSAVVEEEKEVDSAGSSWSGGWFWNKRSGSSNQLPGFRGGWGS